MPNVPPSAASALYSSSGPDKGLGNKALQPEQAPEQAPEQDQDPNAKAINAVIAAVPGLRPSQVKALRAALSDFANSLSSSPDEGEGGPPSG